MRHTSFADRRPGPSVLPVNTKGLLATQHNQFNMGTRLKSSVVSVMRSVDG